MQVYVPFRTFHEMHLIELLENQMVYVPFRSFQIGVYQLNCWTLDAYLAVRLIWTNERKINEGPIFDESGRIGWPIYQQSTKAHIFM